MHMSAAGRTMLKELEGVRTEPYLDVASLETTGCGHLCTEEERTFGLITIGGADVPYRERPLTDAEIDQLLAQDLALAEQAITDAVTVPLTQAQFDALVSWVFNCGIGAFERSTLLTCLNSGDYAGVPAQLRRWNKAGGQTVRGLTRRRARECQCWEGTP
jgi:lysozyme